MKAWQYKLLALPFKQEMYASGAPLATINRGDECPQNSSLRHALFKSYLQRCTNADANAAAAAASNGICTKNSIRFGTGAW